MGKWLSQFSDNTLESRPDKPDILPITSSVSGMSGTFPSMLGNNSNPSSETIPAAPSPPTLALPLTSQIPGANSPENIVLEPAPSNARAIYWEAGDGRILGPAVPDFLGRDGKTFWIVTTFEEQILWINADRLRSRQAFEKCQLKRENP